MQKTQQATSTESKLRVKAFAIELKRRIDSDQIDIPLLPEVANRVLQLTQDESSTAQQLADLVQADQTLAAHVIRVANSATYSPNGSIVSLQQAITRLGMRTIAEIALATSVNASLFNAPGHELDIKTCITQSLACGLWSKEAARVCKRNVEAAFLGGLLQDIGRPMVTHAVCDIAAAAQQTVSAQELAQLQTIFSRIVSSRIVKHWDMPKSVQQVIIYFDQYQAEHDFKHQTIVVVAGSTITKGIESNAATDDIKNHPVFADLNLYDDEIDMILAKKDAVQSTLEAMQR